MAVLTADVLYEMLLQIKHNDPNHQFDSLDLLSMGNPNSQFQQLINDGRVILHNDVIESFDVVE